MQQSFWKRILTKVQITRASDAGSDSGIAVHFLGRDFMGIAKAYILGHQLPSSLSKAFGMNAVFLSSVLG